MIQSVEVTPDIHIQDPSYLINHALFPEVLEALVRRASRSESEREHLELLNVDRYRNIVSPFDALCLPLSGSRSAESLQSPLGICTRRNGAAW